MSKILTLLLALTFLLTACNNQPPQISTSLPATEPSPSSSASSDPAPVKKQMGGILDNMQNIYARGSDYYPDYNQFEKTMEMERAVLKLLRDAMPWTMTEPEEFTPSYSLDCTRNYEEDSVVLHIGKGDGATLLRLDRVKYDTEFFRLPESILHQINELMAPFVKSQPISFSEPTRSLIFTFIELLAARTGMPRDYRNTPQFRYYGKISDCPVFFVNSRVWDSDNFRKAYPVPTDNYSDYPFFQDEFNVFLVLKDNQLYTLSEVKEADFPFDFEQLYEIQRMAEWEVLDTPDERRARLILRAAANLMVVNWDGKEPVVAGEPYALYWFNFEQEVRPYTPEELKILHPNSNSELGFISMSVMEDWLTALFGENHIPNKGKFTSYNEEVDGYLIGSTSYQEYIFPYLLDWEETEKGLVVDCVLAYISFLDHDSIHAVSPPGEDGWLTITAVDLPITKSVLPSLSEIVAVQDQFTQYRANFVRGESGQYYMTSILPTTSPKQK